MSKVKYMGHVSTSMMEMRFSGAEMNVSYAEVGINNPSYACMDEACGLIWDRKHLAESCEVKGHVVEWWQGYGGGVNNNVYKPARSYPRTSIGKLSKAELLGK